MLKEKLTGADNQATGHSGAGRGLTPGINQNSAITELRAADDAVPVDTSELELEQVIIALSELASQRGLLTGCIAEVSP